MPLNKEQAAAYRYAVRLLAGREYSADQLRSRMVAHGHEEGCIEDVLAHLRDTGLQSEERFAESFLRARMKRGEAPWLAAQKAHRTGVDEAALQQALAEAEAGFDAAAVCHALLHRRDPGAVYREDERVWQRQARFLRNKGFDSATILQALNGEDGRYEGRDENSGDS